jgi:hypothetical protein
VKSLDLIHQLLEQDEEVTVTIPISSEWYNWYNCFRSKLSHPIADLAHKVGAWVRAATIRYGRYSPEHLAHLAQGSVEGCNVIDLEFTGTLRSIGKVCGLLRSEQNFNPNTFLNQDGSLPISPEMLEQFAAWSVEDLL